MESVKKSGTLSEISCPRLLAHLHRSKFDGTLRVSRGALLKLLYFQGGQIAMASSNDQADHLAPILIRAGKLKPEQMDLARKSTRPGVSLARVLVQMGFLTSGELFAGARQQLRQIVGSVLPLTDAGYEIQGGFFPREITSLNVDTRELLLDLVRDLTDRSFVLLEVGAPDTVYVPATGGNGADSAPLPRRWKELVERFPRAMAIRDFGQSAGLDDFSASKVVYGLALLGRLAPEPSAEEEASIPAAEESGAPGAAEAAPSLDPGPSPSAPDPVRMVPILSGEADAEGAAAEEAATLPEEAREASASPEHASSLSASVASMQPASEGASTSIMQPSPAAPSPAISREHEASDPAPPIRPIREEVPFRRTASLPRTEPSRPWTVLSILSGLILLALVSYWFIFLRAPSGAGETASQGPPAESAQDPETTPPEARPPGEGTQPSDVPAEVAPARELPPVAGEALPQAAGAGTVEEPQKVEQVSPSPPPAATAAAQPSAAGVLSSPAWSEGRSQLEAGQHAAAARSWLQALRAEPGSFTLQIAIACQEESLRKAARGTRAQDPFFVTAFPLQGRPCYRLCFGIYPAIAQAEAAAGTLPSVLTEGGAHPVVISIRKVIAREGH